MGVSGGRPPYVKMTRKAGEFVADGGAPTLITNSNLQGWNFPAGADAAIVTQLAFPPGWGTYSVNIVWANLSVAVGNVKWQVQLKKLDINISLITVAPYVDVMTPVAAPAQNVLSVAAGLVNLQAVNQAFFGSEYSLRLIRQGATDGVAGAMFMPLVSIIRQG